VIHHGELSNKDLRQKIKQSEVCFGGNRKLKIYGVLQCSSGKRMKKENRVFSHLKKKQKVKDTELVEIVCSVNIKNGLV